MPVKVGKSYIVTASDGRHRGTFLVETRVKNGFLCRCVDSADPRSTRLDKIVLIPKEDTFSDPDAVGMNEYFG